MLVGPLVEQQTQVAFENALPQDSVVRLFSFTGGAYFAEARSDAQGRGVFITDRPLVSIEELAALNESNGKVGPHRFVEPLQTVPVSPGSARGWLGLLLLVLVVAPVLARRTRSRASG